MVGMHFFVVCILILFVVLYFSKEVRNEGFVVEMEEVEATVATVATEAFGMSPGTMDQLSSTRVVSQQEQEVEKKLYDDLTKQGIANMTETGYKGSDFASTAFE
uniref:Uncharacterized protein n=1 Tax=viral metagenome TaxID=1070528 RepID=A0A6C0KMV8_9ZZZZ